MNNRKRRGRPRGSEKNDDRLLEAVAGLLLDKKMPPTAAIKRIMPERKDRLGKESDETLLRRLQRKWEERGDFFMNRVFRRRAKDNQQIILVEIPLICEAIDKNAVRADEPPLRLFTCPADFLDLAS
jgi:hypothetical protein